jgi:hypothetical protein
MRRSWVLCLLGLLLSPSFSWAFQAGGAVKLRVDVELVTTEVTVIDKKGNPVRNLKKEDFRLYEDGKEQEISSFEEVTNKADGTVQAKTVLILFDDSGLPSHEIKPARDSAAKFVKEHMGPTDQFAVASLGMSTLRVLQNFTGDREKVLSAAGQPAVSVAGTSHMDESPAVGWRSLDSDDPRIRAADQMSRRNQWSRLSGVLVNIQSTLERIRGRKCILVYTEAPIMTPPAGGSVSLYKIEPRFDFERDLENIARQLSAGPPSHYYVLGFQSNNPRKDGAFHKLKVKTDIKGVAVYYRLGYVDRRPLDTLANSKREKSLLNAMASPVAAVQLPVAFRASYFYASPTLARVLISAKIRTDKLKLRKTGEQLGCVLSIMGIAYAENGSIAARFSEPLHLNITKDKEQDFRKTGLAYRNQFKLRPGKYRLKIAVSDEAAHVGSMEQTLEVPPLPESRLAISSLVLVEKLSPLPDLIRTLHAKLLDDSDPFVYAGMQVSPSVDNRLPVNSPLSVFFKVYNLAGSPEDWKLVARARLVSEAGEEMMLPPIPLDRSISQTGDSEATVGIDLPFRNMEPGKYRLLVEISGAPFPQSATAQRDLELVKY